MAEGSKTEKASPKKRKDERKKGNIFKSQDVITIVSLIGCFYGLKILFPLIYDTIYSFLTQCFDFIWEYDSLNNEDTLGVMHQLMISAAKGAGPLLLIASSLAILATGIQTKFLFSAESLAPKFSRINPLEGIKKLFSLKNAVELIKNLIKISLLIFILFQFMRDRTTEVTRTMEMDLQNSMTYILKEIIQLIQVIAMWFIAIAAFDFFYQWWDYERQIKMSKQEVKEEFKQTEGNPEIKGRIRDIQRQRAKSRMMQAVPTADVVIRNPTHYAVALKYEKDKYNAPIVVAKGRDELALRIVKIAEENKVCVIENPPLTRAIYASTDLDREILPEYFGLVAEILVYVYRLNNKEL